MTEILEAVIAERDALLAERDTLVQAIRKAEPLIERLRLLDDLSALSVGRQLFHIFSTPAFVALLER